MVIDAFEGERANGATRWLSPTRALIQLSLRYHWEDVFWCTFFHEAGHVALHRKKALFVEVEVAIRNGDGEGTDDLERIEAEADRFASRTLIPPQHERRLRRLTVAQVPAFAEQLDVAPAIVVGRLQHLGLLPYSHGNKLRRRLTFK